MRAMPVTVCIRDRSVAATFASVVSGCSAACSSAACRATLSAHAFLQVLFSVSLSSGAGCSNGRGASGLQRIEDILAASNGWIDGTRGCSTLIASGDPPPSPLAAYKVARRARSNNLPWSLRTGIAKSWSQLRSCPSSQGSSICERTAPPSRESSTTSGSPSSSDCSHASSVSKRTMSTPSQCATSAFESAIGSVRGTRGGDRPCSEDGFGTPTLSRDASHLRCRDALSSTSCSISISSAATFADASAARARSRALAASAARIRCSKSIRDESS